MNLNYCRIQLTKHANFYKKKVDELIKTLKIILKQHKPRIFPINSLVHLLPKQ